MKMDKSGFSDGRLSNDETLHSDQTQSGHKMLFCDIISDETLLYCDKTLSSDKRLSSDIL